MIERLRKLFAKGNALSGRERTILFILLIAGVWAVLDVFLMSPLERARLAEAARMQAARERLLQAQERLAQRESQPSPDVAAAQRLEAARAALNVRMQAANQLLARMVAPKDMARVLRDLTRQQPGLRLMNLHTLPPEPVGNAGSPNELSARHDTPPKDAALYRHGVTLKLAGGYEALVRYMANLEKLPVGFYWARAELDAMRHPDLELTLTLHTLSLERQWLIL